jgi:hypothetical protein
MDELHHPEYWEIVYGIVIHDPDGWRSAGVPWDRAISKNEFNQLAATSTTGKGERK